MSIFAPMLALLLAVDVLGASVASVPVPDAASLKWMQASLGNWETVCGKYLKLTSEPLPWIIFYDKTHAWHLAPDKAKPASLRPTGMTLSFFGKDVALWHASNSNGVWIPSGSAVPVGPTNAPQTFTMPFDSTNSFFLAALPSVFRGMDQADQSFDWENYLLGNVAHEMTHTRQIIDVMRRVRDLRKTQDVPQGIDDNFIQRTWEPVPEYKAAFQKELNQFLTAAFEDRNPEERKRALIEALDLARARHQKFFVGSKAFLREIDSIFLSMEGPAMWVQYQIARLSGKAGVPWQQTVLDLLNRGDSWSQTEGLALFLLIDIYVPNWQKQYFSSEVPSPFAILRQALEQ